MKLFEKMKPKERKKPVKTINGKRFSQFAIVALFLFCIVGAATAFSQGTEDTNAEQGETQEEKPNFATSEAAQTFAEEFANDYLTWRASNPENYEEKMAPYITDEVDKTVGIVFDSLEKRSSVESTAIWKVEETSDKTANITVKVDQIVGNPDNDNEPFTHYVSIPIVTDEENFQVYDLPQYQASPDNADIEVGSTYETPEVTEGEINQSVESFLQTFFTSYTEGTESELGYYAEDANLQPLDEGVFTFQELHDFTVFEPRDNQVYEVDATAKYLNTQTEGEILQHYKLEAYQNDGRWVIKNIQNQ